jgi:hypothetical protein
MLSVVLSVTFFTVRLSVIRLNVILTIAIKISVAVLPNALAYYALQSFVRMCTM